MSVTIRDIARILNLSHTTVSRVLNDRDAISIPEATCERVRTVARQMGYTPNRSAQALVTGRTHLIALQMHRLSAPYAGMVAQEMQALVSADGYEVVVREYGSGDLKLQSSVDGILALGKTLRADYPSGTNRLDVPYVVLGAGSPKTQGQDCVNVDLQVGVRQAVEHLIRQGRRHIVHVTSRDSTQGEDARRDAYRAVMEEAGLRAEFIVVPEDRRGFGRAAVAQCAAQGLRPDALFCRNDELAAGCLSALHDQKQRVPEDVALIGCDGIEEGEYFHPPLTTIVTPVPEMCALAWQFLQRRIAEPDTPPQTAVLASSLLLRQSS